MESLDELLDDYYYDQYENSQVLYYGAQLVREGDIFEIGCYMPPNDFFVAEWTKSGKVLTDLDGNAKSSRGRSPRIIKQADYLGAKQNYSLKVFEASLSDSGNYRCNKMSRKYHKLLVVPQKISTHQLYLIQQRLLSIVNPKSMSEEAAEVFRVSLDQVRRLPLARNKLPVPNKAQMLMLPGYVIIEGEPLVVNCNISDEFVLRRLRESPSFQLTWYKNGKQLRGQSQHQQLLQLALQNNQSPVPQTTALSMTGGANGQQQQKQRSSRLQQQQQQRERGEQTGASRTAGNAPHSAQPVNLNSRIQFRLLNGRQLYIGSAQYSDAGDYLCSWSRLPLTRQVS